MLVRCEQVVYSQSYKHADRSSYMRLKDQSVRLSQVDGGLTFQDLSRRQHINEDTKADLAKSSVLCG